MRISSDLSCKISNMGFVCASLVVLRHIGTLPEKGTTLWWVVKLFDGLTLIAVPYFFVISGFFLARHFTDSERWYRDELFKRLRTIGLPFVIWNLFYIAWFFLLYLMARNMGYSIHITPPDVRSIGGLLTALGLNPMANGFHEHLWYLRMIIVFMLLSPMLEWFIRRFRSPMFLLLTYFTLMLPWIVICRNWELSNFFEFCFSLQGLAYFIIGMWLGVHGSTFGRIRRGVGSVALVGGAVIIFARAFLLYHDEAIMAMCMLWFGIPLSLYGVWSIVACNSIFGRLPVQTFPLYVMHAFVGLPVSALIGWLGGRDVALRSSVSLYFIRWGVVVAATLLLVRIMKSCMPRFYRLAFGARG